MFAFTFEATRTAGFGMVGVTWEPGTTATDVTVEVRTRAVGGDWSGWTEASVEDAEGTVGQRAGTDPLWVGASDAVAVRVSSSNGVAPVGIEVAAVDPGADPSEGTVDEPADGEDIEPVASYPEGQPSYISAPSMISRAAWGAAAPKKCDSPTVANQTMGVVVHHTAGGNTYTKAQSASIVRSTQKYHQQALGWCDIGYNVLVDKYGQIFEGRAGGIDRMVRGAHAGNAAVNQYTWGVSMMGNYDTTRTTTALKDAMVKVIGWRLASNYLPATGTYKIGGVTLNRIAGHRDVKATVCPGRYGYAWMSATGGLRERVASYIAKYTSSIKRFYTQTGRATTGAVKVGEVSTGGGRRTQFQKMDVYYKPGVATKPVQGAILSTYRSLGGETGVMGFPTSNQGARDKVAYQRFQKGTIYRVTSTRAYGLYSVQEDLYRQLKEFRGALGKPTSSTRKMGTTLYRATFAGGRIDYRTNTKQAVAYNKKGKAIAKRSGAWTATATKSSAAATADSVTVQAAKSFTVDGRGFGHGIGMSQYGAQGAARAGKKASQILAYYYPGTKVTRTTGSMRVLLTADTTSDVQVKPRSGLKLRQGSKYWTLPATVGGATVSRWRLTPSGTTTVLQYLFGSGSWKNYRTWKWTGDVQFEGPTSVSTVTLVLPKGVTKVYRGALRSAVPSTGSTDRQTVNVLSLDKYVQGVIAAEMPASWHQEALRSQAIAARTYAVRSKSSARYYDVCDTTSCQVYGGYSAETAATNKAVAAVPGRILTYRGVAALTQFSSSTGGRTAAGSQPYLTAHDDAYDGWSGNPNHTWRVTVSAAAVQRLAPSIGTLSSVTVSKRSGGGTWGGRATRVVLKGSKGSTTLSGDSVRFGLGLKSTWFAFS